MVRYAILDDLHRPAHLHTTAYWVLGIKTAVPHPLIQPRMFVSRAMEINAYRRLESSLDLEFESTPNGASCARRRRACRICARAPRGPERLGPYVGLAKRGRAALGLGLARPCFVHVRCAALCV